MTRRSQVSTLMNSLLTFRLLHLVSYRDFAVAFLATAALLFSNYGSPLQAQINDSWTLAEIRAELQSASNGDTITFANGNYNNIGGLAVNNKTNITIQGAGPNTVIDGRQNYTTIFDINNSSGIVVRDFKLMNASQDAAGGKKGVVHINNSTNVTVEDCVIEVRWTQGGVFIQQGGGNTVQRNRIFNPDRVDYGSLEGGYPADLIFVQDTNGITIDGNDLLTQSQPLTSRVDRSNGGSGTTEPTHLDGIQFNRVAGDCVISNNLVKIDTTWARHHHAMLIELGGSTAKYVIYNNVFYGKKDGQADALVSLQRSPDLYYFVNNVVEGDSPQMFRIQIGNRNSQFKNNIFYRRSNANQVADDRNMIEIDINNSGDWTNNLFWSENSGTGQKIVNKIYSLNQLNSLGSRFANNIEQDPLLTSDWHILPGSNAQDNGTNVSSLTGSSRDIDGDQRTGTWDIGVDELGGGSVVDSVSLDSAPIISATGPQTFLVDYTANGTRDLLVNVFDSDWTWRGQRRIDGVTGSDELQVNVTYNSPVATSTAIVQAMLVQEGGNWMSAVDQVNFTVDVETASGPEFASISGPGTIPRSGPQDFTIAYSANGNKDLLLSIFEEGWVYRSGIRIRNVSGAGEITRSLNYKMAAGVGSAIVQVRLVPAGGSWTESVDEQRYTPSVGGSVAPDFSLNLWNAIPSLGVNVHNTWGVSGLAPNRHLRLRNVDLDTGYNKFGFEYSSGHGSAMRYEVRLGSPNGQLLGTSNFSGTGSWAKSSAQFADANLTPVTGTHDVYIVIKSGYMNAFTCRFRNE